MRLLYWDILNDESARKAAFHQHFHGKFCPESLRFWDWTIFYGTCRSLFIGNTTVTTILFFLFLLSYLFIVFIYIYIYIYISIVFIYSYIHSTTSWSMKKRKKELDHEFNLAILTSHLVNHTYLLPCCIISGFVHFYSSRLEEWWCTVSIFKKEAEVERIKKRRNFLHSSAAGFNRYVVNQSNKWNRCTRKAGNQETQQSYT